MGAKRQIPHIKSHTAGTSNELSFDVLDAARSELDGQKGSSRFRKRTPKGGEGQSVSFLFNGIEGVPDKKGGKQRTPDARADFSANLSVLAAQEEVSRRKKARRAHNIRTRVLVVVAILFVLGVIGTFAYHLYMEQRDFDEKFADLTARFTAIDADIVTADSVMGSLFDVDADEARAKALDTIPRTRNNLAVTKTQALSLQAEAKSSRDQMVMGQMILAIEAREDMITAAQQSIELANKIEKSVAAANDAWAEAFVADQRAREAAQMANIASTDEAFQESKDATDEAIEGFESTLYSLQYLENILPGLDLSAQKAYVEKKIEALRYASETSQAIIDSDREAAVANNNAYNQAEIEAASLAEGLPVSLEPTVRALFDEELERLMGTYDEARTRAIEADSVIRNYLGE